MPIDLAEDVLFVGKAVRVLRAPSFDSGGKSVLWAPEEDAQATLESLQQLAAAAPFDSLRFGSVVRICRQQVEKALWSHLQSASCGVTAHLKALRAITLLGAGAFWAALLLRAGPLLAQPCDDSTANTDLAAIVAEMPDNETSGVVPLLHHFRFTTHHVVKNAPPLAASRDEEKQQELQQPSVSSFPALHSLGAKWLYLPSLDGWDSLLVDYTPPWPLQLLLTPEVLQAHQAVGSLLLRLRRLATVLEDSWAAMCASGRAERCNDTSRPHVTHPLWQLRAHVSHFVACLLHYLQVDVVEVLHQQLVLDTDKAEGLVAATQAGRSFAANVIGAALLDNRAVATSLSLVFQAALQLCHRLAEEDGDMSRAQLDDDLQYNCRKSLQAVVAELRSHSAAAESSAPVLKHLIAALEFNSFFSQSTKNC